MTKNREPDDPTDAIMRSVQRMLDESRAIDTKRALEGIHPDRTKRRNHKHSVSHRSYR